MKTSVFLSLHSGIIRLFSIGLICGGIFVVSNNQAIAEDISWKVVNSHRVIDSAVKEEKFRADFAVYQRCASSIERKKSAGCTGDEYPSLINCPTRNCNYSTLFDGTTYRYRNVHDKERTILARLNIPADVQSCRWIIDSGNDNSHRSIAGPCDGTSLPAIVGMQNLEVSFLPVGGGSRQTRQTQVTIRDILIVVLGDSFVSGEGNPHVREAFPFNENSQDDSKVRTPQWWEVRCHRSLMAGPALAAAKLAESHPDISVTYVSFACSGAEITEGILHRYRGRETDGQALALFRAFDPVLDVLPDGVFSRAYIRPQIVSVRDSLCRDGNRTDPGAPCSNLREPDILVLGIGVNDIGFSDIVMGLVKGSGSVNRTEILKRVNARLRILGERLSLLSPEINSLVSKSASTGRRPVLALEYPDPTRDENGNFCSDVPVRRDGAYKAQLETQGRPFVPEAVALLGFGIDGLENGFAYKHVLGPLNDAIWENAAKPENAWRFVGGNTDISHKHGYCSKSTWFNSYMDAWTKQYFVLPVQNPDDPPSTPDPNNPYHATIGGVPSGAMHPNVFGHLGISEILLAEYERVLAGK